MSPRAAHIFVTGRVQGVTYRASTQRQARRRDLAGWVKNLPDGRVEAWVEGPEPQVEALLRWCEGGPPLARVQDVEVTWQEPEGLSSFDIRR